MAPPAHIKRGGVGFAVNGVSATGKQKKKARKLEGSVMGMVKCMGTVVQRTLLLPPLFLILVICFWVMTSLLPVSVLHVCLSGRRLNMYCVSASTTRFPLGDDKISAVGSDGENQGLRVGSHGLEIGPPLLNESVNALVSVKPEETVNALGVYVKPEISTTHVEISSLQKVENVSNELAMIEKKSIDENVSNELAITEEKSIDEIVSNELGTTEKKSIDENVSNELAITENKSIDEENGKFPNHLMQMFMEAIRSASMPAGMKDPSQKECRGRKIYIYDLPKRFNSELLEQCHNLIPWFNLCDYFTNGGIGKPFENLYEHWYQTHQYSLEIAFHSRISKHPCLVSNPEEANLFYIPFYAGLDVLRWNLRENINSEKRDELALELANWLQGQPWWRRNGGKDHVLVLGKVSWDFRRLKDTDQWGTKLLHLPEMQLVTKLLIERNPWDMNEIGVPYPTFFHPSSDKDIWQWQWQINTAQRPHLISFAGAPRPNGNDGIRSIIIEQCSSRPETCEFFRCSGSDCLSSERAVKLFMKSEFCLHPTGETPTRRSMFDSLIAGCIPVLFDPLTAYYQYPWHLPANESSYSVYIPEESVKERKINVIEVLQKIPEEQRKEMRKTIIQEIMPGVVYGEPDSKFDVFQDAYMISLNNILWRLEKAGISTN